MEWNETNMLTYVMFRILPMYDGIEQYKIMRVLDLIKDELQFKLQLQLEILGHELKTIQNKTEIDIKRHTGSEKK